jgi:hypothetical protein
LGKDRALVEFTGSDDIAARSKEFKALLKQWIAYV